MNFTLLFSTVNLGVLCFLVWLVGKIYHQLRR